MTNTITFFRFSNSESSFDYELKEKQIGEQNTLEAHKNYLKDNPNRSYKKLNDSDLTALHKLNELKKDFKAGLSYKDKTLLDAYNIEERLLKPELNNNSVKERFHTKVLSEFNLDDLKELISQKNYNNHYESYEESKKRVSDTDLHERIEVKDMTELNELIDEMNKKGWSVKQIEGIQSGRFDADFGSFQSGGGGYGYGFTEGIMILWEK